MGDSPNMSDQNLLLTVEDLINISMGPDTENRINFKVLQTVLHIIARQLRMLEHKVEIRPEKSGKKKSKRAKSKSGKSDTEAGTDTSQSKKRKGHGRRKGSVDDKDESSSRRDQSGGKSERGSGRRRRKSSDTSDEGATGRKLSSSETRGKKGQKGDRGKHGRSRSALTEDDDRGGKRKGRIGEQSEESKHGKGASGGQAAKEGKDQGGRGRSGRRDEEDSEDDTGGRGSSKRGRKDRAEDGSQRGGRGAGADDDEDRAGGRKGKKEGHDGRDDARDVEGVGGGGRGKRARGSGLSITVEKGKQDTRRTSSDSAALRVGSIEVVPRSEFETLRQVVRNLQGITGPIPAPTLPGNRQLRDDIAKGSASLTDAMQTMQMTARVNAAEQAIQRMAGLLTGLASSGALPPDLTQKIQQAQQSLLAGIGGVAGREAGGTAGGGRTGADGKGIVAGAGGAGGFGSGGVGAGGLGPGGAGGFGPGGAGAGAGGLGQGGAGAGGLGPGGAGAGGFGPGGTGVGGFGPGGPGAGAGGFGPGGAGGFGPGGAGAGAGGFGPGGAGAGAGGFGPGGAGAGGFGPGGAGAGAGGFETGGAGAGAGGFGPGGAGAGAGGFGPGGAGVGAGGFGPGGAGAGAGGFGPGGAGGFGPGGAGSDGFGQGLGGFGPGSAGAGGFGPGAFGPGVAGGFGQDGAAFGQGAGGMAFGTAGTDLVGGAGGARTVGFTVSNKECVTQQEMGEAMARMRDDLIRMLQMMSAKSTAVAEAAENRAKALVEQLAEAETMKDRLISMEQLVADYNEQLNGFNEGFSTQITSFDEQMQQLYTDMRGGLEQMAQANSNSETAAVMELTERYEGLLHELDSALTANSALHTYQRSLEDELRRLIENVELLREQKSDRDEMLDGLRDKADNSRLAGLLTELEFATVRQQLEGRILVCNDKFEKQDSVWQGALRDMTVEANDKAELLQLLSTREEFSNLLNDLHSKLQDLATIVGEPTHDARPCVHLMAAVLTRKLAKDGSCAVCCVPAHMMPTEPTFGEPAPLPAFRPPAVGAADGECLPEWMHRPEDIRDHICLRWCGGSHTLLPHGAPAPPAPPPLPTPRRPRPGHGADGKMYMLEEELQPCKECNVLESIPIAAVEEAA